MKIMSMIISIRFALVYLYGTHRTSCGQQRPYALFTLAVSIVGVSILLAVSIVGVSILLAVNLTSLYGNPEDADHYVDNSSTKDGSLTTAACFSINPSLPKLGGGVDDKARYAPYFCIRSTPVLPQ